jgi:transcriptional regulator of heat shock response
VPDRSSLRTFVKTVSEPSRSQESNAAHDVSTAPSSDFPTGTVIGLIVGILAAIVLVVVVVCICRKRRRLAHLDGMPMQLTSAVGHESNIGDRPASAFGAGAYQPW